MSNLRQEDVEIVKNYILRQLIEKKIIDLNENIQQLKDLSIKLK
ncbi:MAG TPA: hypothetical protein VMV49_11780 [Candidatus Deferrimicrobium sp.]|nr:hypothetical protein [Candidatus Deferrimicrobium sp.]